MSIMNLGAAWFWDHELPIDIAMTLLSDNFGKFVDALVAYGEILY